MKTEVYSWRVSTELKAGLEREARRRKLSLSAVLDTAAREWLSNSSELPNEQDRQRILHQAASKCLGSLSGGDPHRSESVRQTVRERLRRQYGR